MHELADEILDTLWEFARPCFIGFVACVGWGLFLQSRNKLMENFAKAGIVVGVTGIFGMFSFLNIEGSNIATLGRLRPLWGAYGAFVAIAGIAMICRLAVIAFRGNGQIHSLHLENDDGEGLSIQRQVGLTVALGAIWLCLFTLAVVWLWLIDRATT